MLKILACIFMLIDHIGVAFFPNTVEWRLIGRLSMPLFAYAIARGAHFTHDRKKYIIRIAILAALSQIPFALFLKIPLFSNLNICFTWLFALLIIELKENKNIKKFLNVFLMFLLFLITTFIKMDYGLYAVLLTLIFYYFGIKTNQFIIIMPLYLLVSITPIITGCLQSFSMAGIKSLIYLAVFQLTSIISLPPIKYISPYDKKLTINKYVFYWFYPVHMALIAGISYLL